MKLRRARWVAAGAASMLVLALSATACNRVVLYQLDDAAIDAPPPDALQLVPRTELTSGAARATSRTYTLDVQFGHAVDQTVSEGATYRLEVIPPIKP